MWGIMDKFLDELKPCPFCGGRAYIQSLFGKLYVTAAHDTKCLVHPDTFLVSEKSLKKQVKAWNRREA